jgi:hypothetical protein
MGVVKGDGKSSGGGPRVDEAEVVAAIQRHMDGLTLPSWPVFALSEADRPGMLASASEDESGLRAVRLDYRLPGAAQRLSVQTQPDRGHDVDLSRLIAQVQAEEDDPHTLAANPTTDAASASGDDVEVVVDGEQAPAVRRRSGGAAVWLVRTGGVLVMVAARQVPITRVALVQVTDLTPYKQERRRAVERLLAGRPWT